MLAQCIKPESVSEVVSSVQHTGSKLPRAHSIAGDVKAREAMSPTDQNTVHKCRWWEGRQSRERSVRNPKSARSWLDQKCSFPAMDKQTSMLFKVALSKSVAAACTRTQ